MTAPFPPEAVRDAIASALPATATSFVGDPIRREFVYLPPGHARALSPHNMLVRGIRGSGKTFWWKALQDAGLRSVLRADLPRVGLEGAVRIVPGFGAGADPDRYPGRDAIAELLQTHEARLIWRAVLLWAVADEEDALPRLGTWGEKVGWVAGHAEAVDSRFHAIDARALGAGEVRLVLFDALDRAAADWGNLLDILRGLLQLLVETRELRAIRAKAFVRDDMLADPRVLSFPDASKVIADAVDLAWPPRELYSLLWQYVGNAPAGGGEAFRSHCATTFGLPWQEVDGIHRMPAKMRRDEKVQEKILHAITGPWMGHGPRRGNVYSWLPGHLADAHRQVSPRSFLVALRQAAAGTEPSNALAVDWRAIREGVREASRIRVAELVEDHPWVDVARRPLEGLKVPCSTEELTERWAEDGTLENMGWIETGVGPTLPRHFDDGYSGLLRDLGDLGVLHRLGDGRWQMPDVYRVAFHMGRKGGIPPLRP
ncbi:hypothetical protein L6R50_05645 [Myxococcota bacterium]|nr:hypothetical protein [Myxococcota bacterium]